MTFSGRRIPHCGQEGQLARLLRGKGRSFVKHWLPPRQPYVLNRKILLTTAAKIPPYVPQNFGGSKRTFWNQFELTSCDASTKCSPSPRNIPSRRVRLFTCEHRNLQSLSLWQVAFRRQSSWTVRSLIRVSGSRLTLMASVHLHGCRDVLTVE
jgi:hypothetical protein